MDYKIGTFDLRRLKGNAGRDQTALGSLIVNTQGKTGERLRMAGDKLLASNHKHAPMIHEHLFGKEEGKEEKKYNPNFTDNTLGDYGDADDSREGLKYQQHVIRRKNG